MKKLSLLLLTLLMLISFSACQSKQNPVVNLEGSLESILDNIYEKAEVDDSMKDFINERFHQ